MSNSDKPPIQKLRVAEDGRVHGLSHTTSQHNAVKTTRLHNSEMPTGQDLCLVVIQGQELARRYQIRAGTQRIGRGSNCEIRLSGRGISRTHAKLVKAGGDVMVADLQSTNGTLINGKENAWTKLDHGDRITIGDTVLKVLSTDQLESAYYDEIYRLTTTDDHTGTFNRRYFFQTLEREISRSIRHQHPLALTVVDIDNLSSINDEFGPVCGDAVLVQVASRIGQNIRREDVLARIGGDEFCLLLPETSREGAECVATRLQREINRTPFMNDDEPIHITASFGIAELEDIHDDITYKGKCHNALRHVDALIENAASRAAAVNQRGGDDIGV